MTYSLLLGFAFRITFTISHKKMPLIPEGIFFISSLLRQLAKQHPCSREQEMHSTNE